MSYRNDLDALEAREAALAKELADKQRERDQVARLLEEARERDTTAQADPDSKARSRRRWLLAGATVTAACGVAVIALVQPDPPTKDMMTSELGARLTCADVEPDHRAAQRANDEAFGRALAERGMKPIALEPRWLGGMMGAEHEDDLDVELGMKVPAWQQFTYKLDGHPRQAIADAPYQVHWLGRAPVEFAQDEHGNIWRIKRAVRETKVLKNVKVEACSWGCWGQPPPGAVMPPNFKRDIYLLPGNSHYLGEVEIAYEEQTIHIEIVDLGCPTPA